MPNGGNFYLSKSECIFRPCRPWQGRSLGRRPQQQLTAVLRIAPPVGRRLGLRPSCSSVSAVAERQKSKRLCPSRRFVNPRAVIRNGGAGGGRPSWPPQRQGCCAHPSLGRAKFLKHHSMTLGRPAFWQRTAWEVMCIGFRSEAF